MLLLPCLNSGLLKRMAIVTPVLSRNCDALHARRWRGNDDPWIIHIPCQRKLPCFVMEHKVRRPFSRLSCCMPN